MVQPRPRPQRPPRLKRPLHVYLRALRKAALVRAAIDEVTQRGRDDPDEARYAMRALPAWMQPMVLAQTPPPRPDIRVFHRWGHGRLGPRGRSRRGASAVGE